MEIATPTKEATLSLSIPTATAAPANKAIIHPTHKERISPLKRYNMWDEDWSTEIKYI